MGILIALIVGGLAGLIAGYIMRDNLGIFWNVVVGFIGAIIGNFVVGFLGGPNVDLAAPTLQGFLVAILGSVILLAIVNKLSSGRVR